MRPIIAIVGRPNVGKSTLFNRLIQEHRALVDDTPGVTRDRIHGLASFTDFWGQSHEVNLVDTGGIDTSPDEPFAEGILLHVKRALEDADVVLFLVDGMSGPLPEDGDVYRLLRKSGLPIVVVVNKCERYEREVAAAEFHALGIDQLVAISAAHGRNITDLGEALLAKLPDSSLVTDEAPSANVEGAGGFDENYDKRPIRVAVVGRPNVGKSTLVNQLLGDERVLVSDIPGTTRDAIDVEVELDGRKFLFVDTAGMRRKGKIDERIERSSVFMAIRQIERADVVLILVDPSEGVTHQDQQIASLVSRQYRPTLILVNKWDLLPRERREDKKLPQDIRDQLRFLTESPMIYISAKTGRGMKNIPREIEVLHHRSHKKIGTGELNRFLERAVAAHQPPSWRTNIVRLNYMTQVRAAPPTFVIFANHPQGIEVSYRRFLMNRLREEFDLQGTPIRIVMRMKHAEREREAPHVRSKTKKVEYKVPKPKG
mgnify:CR=1 FL=1